MNPFLRTPGALMIRHGATLEDWERHAPELFEMQRYVPWWIGDMVVYGEAQYGDDFWQAVPLGVSESMISRFAGMARKYPPGERVPGVSWSHHAAALRIEDKMLRRSLLRKAEEENMTNSEFQAYVREFVRSRGKANPGERSQQSS